MNQSQKQLEKFRKGIEETLAEAFVKLRPVIKARAMMEMGN